MDSHDTHYITKGSKCSKNENNNYIYDNSGNIVVDSVDDLIYEKYIKNNKLENRKNNDRDNYFNLISDNKSHNLIKSINNQLKEKSMKQKNLITLRVIPIEESHKNLTFYIDEDNQINNYSFKNTNYIGEKNLSFTNDKFLVSNISYDDNRSKSKNKSNKHSKVIKQRKKNNSYNKIKNPYRNHKLISNKKINLSPGIIKNRMNKKEKEKNNKSMNKTFSKSFNIKNYNYRYKNEDNNNERNNFSELDNKSLTLKLKLKSNEISSIYIEKDNYTIEKLQKEYILFKPQIQNCYITKQTKSNNNNNFIYTVRNLPLFFRKDNFDIGKYIPIHFIRTSEVNSKEKNKINLSFKNKDSKKNSRLGKIKGKCYHACESLKIINKKNYNEILSKTNKNLLHINKGQIKRNREIPYNDNLLKKIKSIKNKLSINSKNKVLKKENSYNSSVPILSMDSKNKIDNNIYEKNYNKRNKSNINFQLNEILKKKKSINNCPSCLEIIEKTLNKKNHIFDNSKNAQNNKKEKTIIKRNKKNLTHRKIFNNKLIDYCRKDEINKIKIINDNKKLFKDYLNSRKEQKKTKLRKYFSSYNQNYKKTKTLIDNNYNLIEYFSNEDSDSLNNYTKLINIEFPVINSYFHRNNFN